MKITDTQMTYELTGEELANKLEIEGCITSIEYTSTDGHEGFTSKVTIQVKK
jgi:hypothetical protein